RKAQARAALSALLESGALAHGGKTIIVRTNAPRSPHFEADLDAIVRPGVDLINQPKIESPAMLLAAIVMIEQAERAHGVTQPTSLLVNVETPQALADAAKIAAAHPRVNGLQLGLGDLFEAHGIDRADPRNVHAAMFTLRLAAARAGVMAVDGAFASLEDEAGYCAEARMARQLGFVGKTCVHPRQVALANRIFAPTEAELERAQRIVDASLLAANQAQGVFVVDGKMVDLPFLKRAQAMLATAGRAT
ncbi:MAG: CoA ester lyase, partial [Pseudomonadota bacterium]|nr:CoA ester lyase [Pseudomonadota bacterium]